MFKSNKEEDNKDNEKEEDILVGNTSTVNQVQSLLNKFGKNSNEKDDKKESDDEDDDESYESDEKSEEKDE